MTINIKRGPNYTPGSGRIVTKGSGGGIVTKIPPPSIITPDQMTGLRAWYKMDAQPYSNGDSVGIGGNGFLGNIIDSSGNGLDLTFDIGGNYDNYASYVASDPKFNGKPSISGKFIFKRLMALGDLPSGSQPFAMYVVVHQTAAELAIWPTYNSGYSFGWGRWNNRTYTAFLYNYGSPEGTFMVDFNFFAGASAGGTTTSPLDITYILAYSYNGGSEDLYPLYVNNDSRIDAIDNGSSLNIPAESDYWTAELKLGGLPGGGAWFMGSIAEAIAFADYHDATKMNQVRSYLNNKYQAY